MCALGVSIVAVQAQEDRATVQLRDGTRIEGHIDGLRGGSLTLRVSQNDQRRIPVGTIALIDRKGGASGLPDTEIREARNAEHLLLLTSGSSQKGSLVEIVGGQGSGDAGPRTYVFRTTEGVEHKFSQDQVSRIYLGSYPFEAAVREATAVDTAVPAGAIRVPANAAWVSTGLAVRKGDRVTFNTSGEVQLSSNSADRAHSAGTLRTATLSPLPNANAGALIGRIGLSGRVFGIGDQTMVPMPDSGMLYLAVNDDERSDNAGEFIVVVGRQ
ncbi:MAG: hypothetical protein ABI665_24485 [Vicinamibacterales bacterium]